MVLSGLLDAEVVLLVHAHPDDETLATGALAAELSSRGARVVLLTATRGERGEVVPGPLSALAGTPALVSRREAELARAAQELGIRELYWLGTAPARAAGRPARRYGDSGMRWVRPGLAGPAEATDPGSLTAAPLAEVVADVAALLAHTRPDVVVTYDQGGGYGHPDHVRVHEAALAACRAAAPAFAEVVHEPGPGVTWLELDHRRPQVVAALTAHASQVRVDGSEVVHSGGQREPLVTSLGLRQRS